MISDRIYFHCSPAGAVSRQVWLLPGIAVWCNWQRYGIVMVVWPYWPLRVNVVLSCFPVLLIVTTARVLYLLRVPAVSRYWSFVVVGGSGFCSTMLIDANPCQRTFGFWPAVLRPVFSSVPGSLRHPDWNSDSTFYQPCYKRYRCYRPAICCGSRTD